MCFQFYGCVCGHNTENISYDMHTGTRNVILAKHKL